MIWDARLYVVAYHRGFNGTLDGVTFRNGIVPHPLSGILLKKLRRRLQITWWEHDPQKKIVWRHRPGMPQEEPFYESIAAEPAPAEAATPAAEPKPKPLSKLSKAELAAKVETMGLEVPEKAKKADLLALIRAAAE